ncbi:hypothetical protein CC86DRAFT_302434 [Ophiobolus disseminans]|uniref:Polyketide cyclase/dehydrase n=1 Tax=Ophiobolus disseminans TaxID=1469910 RepID=A0A6A6ZMN3_9PLEO|nr:hypothetical protein CC86DRAFT_302434 [Ophiobolus disseminans]
MVKVRIETEIAASPAEVRAIVFDFARYPEWHKGFINSIAPTAPNKSSYEILPGETLNTKIGGVSLSPVVVSNTTTEFAWRGSVYGGAFAGRHYCQFIASHVTPSGTTFVHGEDYDGWMSWLFGEGALGIGRKNVVAMFGQFNIDVKRRAEDMKKLEQGIQQTQTEPYSKL